MTEAHYSNPDFHKEKPIGDGKTYVEHHIKYKEIHGYDETVWIEKGKHHSLHCKLRKEGKCKVPVDKLNEISTHAWRRTEKGRAIYNEVAKRCRYYPSQVEGRKRYRMSEKGRKSMKEYRKRMYIIIPFNIPVGEGVSISIKTSINKNTNTTYSRYHFLYHRELSTEERI